MNKRVKYLLMSVIFFTVASVFSFGNVCHVMASENSENAVLEETLNTIGESDAAAKSVAGEFFRKALGVIPYVGVVLFVIGVAVAVFSVRNKGLRRWGVKLAVAEAVITYLIYIALTMVYDYAFCKKPVGSASRPEQAQGYEKVYYDVREELAVRGQSFTYAESGWVNGCADASRGMFGDVAPVLVFTSVSCGILLLIVGRKNKSVRNLAIVGLCIAIPVALVIGYRYIRL